MNTWRKILTTGVGAALMTENSIRNALFDIQLPRQAKNYLTKQAMKGKEEMVRVLTDEIKRFLTRINLHEELKKAVSGLSIDIQASIKIGNPASGRPSKLSFGKVKVKK